MKKTFTLLIILFSFLFSFSQKYDLIVTIKGDSIACYIDSITSTTIFYEMKYKYNKVHTWMNKKDISDFKRNAIDKKTVRLKPGSSYIIPSNQIQTGTISLIDIRKNSVSIELGGNAWIGSLNYERIVPIDKKFGIGLRGGFSLENHPKREQNPISVFFIGELNSLFFGPKHFLDIGVGAINGFDDEIIPTFRLGYRYQGEKGLYLRAGVISVWLIIPGLSIGYSF